MRLVFLKQLLVDVCIWQWQQLYQGEQRGNCRRKVQIWKASLHKCTLYTEMWIPLALCSFWPCDLYHRAIWAVFNDFYIPWCTSFTPKPKYNKYHPPAAVSSGTLPSLFLRWDCHWYFRESWGWRPGKRFSPVTGNKWRSTLFHPIEVLWEDRLELCQDPRGGSPKPTSLVTLPTTKSPLLLSVSTDLKGQKFLILGGTRTVCMMHRCTSTR